jgi:hypothetical protein
VVKAVQARKPQPLDTAGRTMFIKSLLPADQTQQIRMVSGSSPAAKILREAQ